ncbi:MAG TPA: NAD(P)-binding domain-containing protein [Thermoanaerobaculia bacterium]
MNHGVSIGGEVSYEYLILGAGPAGLQMGHHLSRAGHSYLILEAGDSPGTFFKKYPRHRTLAARNKIHTGSQDPEVRLRFDECSLLDEDGDGAFRFADVSRSYLPSADEMVSYLCGYAERHGLNVRCDTRILRVERTGAGLFRLTDAAGNVFSCRRLIVATGTARPHVPAIPGVDQVECYADVSVDPEDFANQRVLVIGQGSPAAETADNLIPTAALVHTLSDRAVERIERSQGQLLVSVRRADGGGEEWVYDRVIVATGFRFDDSIFASGCRPELAPGGRLPARTAEWEAVNVPGLYFAGSLAQANGFETHPSGLVHGFRYNARALFRMLEASHHRRGWPAQEIEPTPEGLVEATLARLNRTSALWQLPGFLHDVIVVDEDWNGARYCEEMPLAYLRQSEIGQSSHYYTITLERGEDLHPVIRRWSGGQLVSDKHLPADLFGEWKKPEAHVAPLRYFYMQQLLEIADLEDAGCDIPLAEMEPQRMLRIV